MSTYIKKARVRVAAFQGVGVMGQPGWVICAWACPSFRTATMTLLVSIKGDCKACGKDVRDAAQQHCSVCRPERSNMQASDQRRNAGLHRTRRHLPCCEPHLVLDAVCDRRRQLSCAAALCTA
jgi:hypothetical protein